MIKPHSGFFPAVFFKFGCSAEIDDNGTREQIHDVDASAVRYSFQRLANIGPEQDDEIPSGF